MQESAWWSCRRGVVSRRSVLHAARRGNGPLGLTVNPGFDNAAEDVERGRRLLITS